MKGRFAVFFGPPGPPDDAADPADRYAGRGVVGRGALAGGRAVFGLLAARPLPPFPRPSSPTRRTTCFRSSRARSWARTTSTTARGCVTRRRWRAWRRASARGDDQFVGEVADARCILRDRHEYDVGAPDTGGRYAGDPRRRQADRRQPPRDRSVSLGRPPSCGTGRAPTWCS